MNAKRRLKMENATHNKPNCIAMQITEHTLKSTVYREMQHDLKATVLK